MFAAGIQRSGCDNVAAVRWSVVMMLEAVAVSALRRSGATQKIETDRTIVRTSSVGGVRDHQGESDSTSRAESRPQACRLPEPL